MKKIFLFAVTLLAIQLSYSQHRCGYVEYMNHLYQKNPELKKEHDAFNTIINTRIDKLKSMKTTGTLADEIVYEIPVVVHVIYNNFANGITNISDAQIYSQIDILNKDYSRLNADTTFTYPMFKGVAANVKIRFCLANTDPNGSVTNGIVRVFNKKTAFTMGEEAVLKRLSYWPNDQYLNLWVCNIDDNILGYAQFPTGSGLAGIAANGGADFTDGVVIDYQAFGNIGTSTAPYNMGRTATHEIGHWLGLIHIWGDEDCGDDFVADTPPQETSNGTQCDTMRSNCTGPSMINMIQNYMDYSSDACMNIFTKDQKLRMRTVMEVSPKRMALLNSSGCCPPETKIMPPMMITFEDDSYLEDNWQVLNFDASSSYSKNWTKVTPGAYGESNNALMIENDSVYTKTDSTYWDVLQSPLMDLSKSGKFQLNFDLAYAHNMASTTQTDSLVIYYNLGCRDFWIPCKTLYGSDLVSTVRQANDFEPGVDEWKRVLVDLNFLASRERVKFRIAVFSKGINKLYIDNINFYQESDEFNINLFPVPAEGEINVEALFNGYQDVKIEAFNTLGKKLFERERKNTTSFIENIKLSDFGAGCYIFRVTSGGNKRTKKIIVN